MNQDYSGDITCDESSKVKLVLTEGSSYSGTFDAKGTAAYSKVYLSKSSKWNVTGDSHVSSLRNGDKKKCNIQSGGHTIYYDKTGKPTTGWAARPYPPGRRQAAAGIGWICKNTKNSKNIEIPVCVWYTE